MLNEIEENRKNELFRLMDDRTITTMQLMELRDLTSKTFNNVDALCFQARMRIAGECYE